MGAVIHRLGRNLVVDRVMRRHYGIEKAVPFDPAVHPKSHMTLCPDGTLRCDGLIHWDAKKVLKLLVSTNFRETICRSAIPSSIRLGVNSRIVSSSQIWGH
jgi:hypothetical protein